MQRNIEKYLYAWKKDERRRPLLIRGARQIGKSYTITQFGSECFTNCVIVNFEQEPRYKECFQTLIPNEIINAVAVLSRAEITPGKTLLFLDEIQECPRAITALRYFYEQMLRLHVIGAGSLLEFARRSNDFKVPVGRIQYLYMKPMSFSEFLKAVGEERALEQSRRCFGKTTLPAAVHQHLINLIKKYMILGGMPAVIDEYIKTQNINRCLRIQSSITQTYRDDFGKYASLVKHKYLDKVFYAVPKMVGKKFKYSAVDSDLQSRDLKEALSLLGKAGIINLVKRTKAHGLPLEAETDSRYFKTIFLDVGLMQNMSGLTDKTLFADDLHQINAGALAEQFVGQELLAHTDPYQDSSLYYWAREARNSSAEIDYIHPFGSNIIPIEVKSGKTGRLRSLILYIDTYHPCCGLKISQAPFLKNLPVISIPLYGIAGLRAFLANGSAGIGSFLSSDRFQ